MPANKMTTPLLLILLFVATLSGCLKGGDHVGRDEDAPTDERGRLVTVDPHDHPLPLGVGDYARWDVPKTSATLALDYTIQVEDGANRLRVAFDRPGSYGDDRLELRDSDGTLVDAMDGGYSAEVFAEGPEPGDWTVRVFANRTQDDPMRMRAKLEASPPTAAPGEADDEVVALLPNLRPVAPLDLRFWLEQANTGVAGRVPLGSCHADEIVEDGAQRCLRFAFGYGNIGDGPYEVLFAPVEDGMTEGAVHQRIQRSDGTTEMRDGGRYEYHATHGHYHYEGILQADLYRVHNRTTGELAPLVEAAKRGACAHDYRLAHFDAFIAQPRGLHDSGDDCNVLPGRTSPTGARIGLSRGWTDLYGAALQDNYVEASDVDDGRYMLRATIDVEDSVAETNETDNVGYTYFEVTGDGIAVLERGLGDDPWDPEKVVTEEWVP